MIRALHHIKLYRTPDRPFKNILGSYLDGTVD